MIEAYLFFGFFWGLSLALILLVACPNNEKDIRALAARYFIMTPIWPIPALFLTIKGIIHFFKVLVSALGATCFERE